MPLPTADVRNGAQEGGGKGGGTNGGKDDVAISPSDRNYGKFASGNLVCDARGGRDRD